MTHSPASSLGHEAVELLYRVKFHHPATEWHVAPLRTYYLIE